MIAYPIDWNSEDVLWTLFTEESTRGFGHSAPRIAQVLYLVRVVFQAVFGSATVSQHSKLAVIHSDEGPQTFRCNELIFLSSQGEHYLQHIYQFSHELCHFMVPAEVCSPYRWFEETLCQAMSWYTLQRIYNLGDNNPLPWLSELCRQDPTYISSSQHRRIPLNSASLSAFISQRLPHLQGNCYDRDTNRTIAYEVYPLLEEHPSLWLIVPHLAKLRPDMSLSDAIHFLLQEAGAEEPGGHQLLYRLCQ